MHTIKAAISLGFLLALGLAQASAQTGTGAGGSQVQSDCLEAAAGDQAAQPAGIGLPSGVPCGQTKTIYQNASTKAVTVTGQFAANCSGAVSFADKGGNAIGGNPIPSGDSQTISFTVPAGDRIDMTCGGKGTKPCTNILLNITVN